MAWFCFTVCKHLNIRYKTSKAFWSLKPIWTVNDDFKDSFACCHIHKFVSVTCTKSKSTAFAKSENNVDIYKYISEWHTPEHTHHPELHVATHTDSEIPHIKDGTQKREED